MLKYIVIINRTGQTRLSRFYDESLQRDKTNLCNEIYRKCITASEHSNVVYECRDHRFVMRRFASIFVIVGFDDEENELAIYEFIHFLVQIYDLLFDNACEVDIISRIDDALWVIDTIVCDGLIMNTNREAILEECNYMKEKNSMYSFKSQLI
ncbi:AP-4 complex subunit sigma-1, putative [Entamoeba dispar SAW760]|uniref:AP complex subunit sigma n=1 Tax=Entamoeba dispar (strain ATCC PRA-260 / SAW760) TaxID=370354 RepID=B0EE62_ENTDS|nr:AP-4 complex subunit sigma-1, putative [Entamoeba dispar SAW760]EDR27186.1 AP-4 complex subunit sigma-1, putative [Entamoeba dispar SAW760]|eukprot:EDR27186.1 AP-4 complex subunit sigma-1, putative [Entamoeba dispar SAW760]